MAISNKLDYFVQVILDVIIIKTGIIISEERLCEILNQALGDESIFKDLEKNRNNHYRIRSEEFDEYCSIVRKKLGESERSSPDLIGEMEKMISFQEKGWDVGKAMFFVVDLMKEIHEESTEIDATKIIELAEKKGTYPTELISEIVNKFVKHQKTSNFIYPIERELSDGGQKIEDLFEKELIPKHNGEYIDQKFINYLEANPEQLEFINWRNFERLTAEFFIRANFEVELGPGTNDGGIDVKVFSKDDKKAPFIIIQCKRHKQSNEVKINTVKALYTDVEHEDAEYGLIATTSRVAPGGKKVCSIRKYPIGFAENNEIQKWISKMKKR